MRMEKFNSISSSFYSQFESQLAIFWCCWLFSVLVFLGWQNFSLQCHEGKRSSCQEASKSSSIFVCSATWQVENADKSKFIEFTTNLVYWCTNDKCFRYDRDFKLRDSLVDRWMIRMSWDCENWQLEKIDEFIFP